MAIEHTFVPQDVDGGVVYVVPVGTTLPTKADKAELSVEIKAGDLGTIAVDGLSIGEVRESNTVPDFNGDDYITHQTSFSGEFKFTVLDVDKQTVLELLNGAGNVTGTAADSTSGALTTINHAGEQLPLQSFVFTTKSGDKLRFDVLEFARVSEVAEYKLESQDAMKVEVTLKATKNADGNLFVTYLNDGKPVVTP